ncbi:pentatricopeptide repeat-containing protein At4g21065 [Phoenix dactylifera]|uniref:Pentatricopeptide repeat-containing protein At4g21065 n=1 Tax=Phoenix dactylifera TaxID=42345 RepID=A0A8B7BRK3_PHODC|nr:pentatricopeptide repeat-containing protein At4g21065 [Phoenix dactylifera]
MLPSSIIIRRSASLPAIQPIFHLLPIPHFIPPISSSIQPCGRKLLSSHSAAALSQTRLPQNHPIPNNTSPRDYRNYSSLLQSFVTRKALEPGKQLHARLILSGLRFDTVLATKLVNLYSVCNSLPDAHNLFDRIHKGNLFLWNVLIRGYAWNGPYEVALKLYYQMLDHGLEPDNFTFPFVLKACSALSALEVGRDIHDLVIRTRWNSDVFVGAGLIDMYAKCGCVDEARDVFDRIPDRDVVLWNSMIAAYSQNGHPSEALSLCRDMVAKGFQPTVATLVTVISASADAAALPRGREIHGFCWRRGFESQDKVKTALVDMYAKSGWVGVARVLFEQLVEKRAVSWNAMICGYGMHGHADEALALFDKMREEAQVLADHITFVGVLSACNHGGLMEEGRQFFNLMVKEYSIEPTVQHYTCMIDLLGHSGNLDEAYQLIQDMSMKPDSGVWGALLNGCKIHRNVELGELALQKLIELEPNDAGNYVLLSNIYAQAGKWEEAARVRKLMTDRGLKKSIACSWIEVKGTVHAFLVGDLSHPRSEEIYAELEILEGLMKEAGYVPDTMSVFHDVEDDEKQNMVRSHSERLAIAFGLISTPPGTQLLVTKNLRVCEDCHAAIKFISKIVEREIIIRDVNRYHHFKDGECSCQDYW